MADHVLKIHEQPFNDLSSGAKTCEVRNNDRGFQPGDTVQLHEIADDFTGRVMARKITHVQTGYGLPDGLCVLSYAQLPSQGGEAVAAWQYQSRDGGWCNFTDEKHRVATVEDGTWPIRPLYTHPADQVAEGVVVSRDLLERWLWLIENHPVCTDPAETELRALLEVKP